MSNGVNSPGYNLRRLPNNPWRRYQQPGVPTITSNNVVDRSGGTSEPPQINIFGTGSAAGPFGHQTLNQSDTGIADSGVISQPLIISGFSVFVLNSMESSLASQAGLFTGEPGGPSLMHLRQNYQALMTELKLKPNSDRLTQYDHFNLLVKMTAGGARDQAGALERRLIADLKERNAAALRNYERDLANYERQKVVWDATLADQRVANNEPKRPDKPAPLTEYTSPVDAFWEHMEELYPERSSTRLDEFTHFMAKPGKTIANLSQRMQTLRSLLNQPEHMALFRLLGAYSRNLHNKVKRQLIASGLDVDKWTVQKVSELAVRIDRTYTEEKLWTAAPKTEASSSRSAPPAGQRVYPRTCNICEKQGHIAHNCLARPKAAHSAQQAPAANGQPKPKPDRQHKQSGPCYCCGEMGHLANVCPTLRQPRGNAQQAGQAPGQPWCDHHKVSTHNTSECRALQQNEPRHANQALQSANSAAHPMDATPSAYPGIAHRAALL
jgi:hypothetical protein